MPEATIAPAPAAPAAPATSPSFLNMPPQPPSPAMEKAFGAMDDFTGQPKRGEKATAKPAPKAPEPKAKEPPPKEPVKAADPEPEADPLEEGEVASETKDEVKAEDAAVPKGDGKQNPWKLVESYKSKASKLEKQLADVTNGKAASPEFEAKLKGAQERADTVEKQYKALRDELSFRDYSTSEDFQKNYAKPYERACESAAKDLAELGIEGTDGNMRKATMSDLLALCNMPLGQARQQAETWFGSSADDVMAHRREVQRLYQSQQTALEEAKGKGEERIKTQTESWNKLREESADLWQKFNQEASEKYDFLKPKEGDEEYNSKLDFGKKLVEEAFARNALDPKLSPEDRAKAIKAQVAIRNRAIAYSTLKLENTRLKAKLAEHEKSLKEFQESEPTAGRGKATNGKAGKAVDAKQAAFQRMEANYVT